MRLHEVHQLLEIHFQDNWDIEDVPALFDNAEDEFEEPEGSWVHFQVLFGAAQNQSRCADGISVRQSGSIQLYIYVELDEGAGEAYAIADKFRECFMNKSLGEKGQVATTDRFVAQPELISNRFQSRVSIPFFYSTK